MKTIHSLSENLSEGMMLPKGSSDERGNPEAGYFRYNTDDKKIEVFDGTDWSSMDYAPSYVTSGLALHFDAGNPNSYGGTGSTWSDLSQGGNNGSITGASHNSEGYFTFNGTSDSISTSYNPSITASTEYTFEFWMKTPSSLSSNGALFDSVYDSSGTDNTIRIFLLSGVNEGKLYFSEDDAVNSTVYSMTTNTFNDGSWHHFCFVASSSTLEIYADGSSVSSAVSRAGGSGAVSNSVSHSFMSNNLSDYCEGDLGIVRFYMNKALSTSEVTQNFDANKSRFGL